MATEADKAKLLRLYPQVFDFKPTTAQNLLKSSPSTYVRYLLEERLKKEDVSFCLYHPTDMSLREKAPEVFEFNPQRAHEYSDRDNMDDELLGTLVRCLYAAGWRRADIEQVVKPLTYWSENEDMKLVELCEVNYTMEQVAVSTKIPLSLFEPSD